MLNILIMLIPIEHKIRENEKFNITVIQALRYCNYIG